MISLDEEARTLQLTIDDLVAPGSPRESGRSGGREQLEAEARARHLAKRTGERIRERVELSSEFDWRGYRVQLHGLADALCERDSEVVVELQRFVPAESATRIQDAVAHVGLLCLLVHRSGTPVLKGLVVDLSLVDEAAHSLDVVFSVPSYERVLDLRLEVLHRTCLEEQRLARARADQAERLAFPFPEIRPGQDSMLREVEGAARSGLILLCSAPTGIGKTAAALHPMLKRALFEDRTLFFLTARVSQQELALETLRRQLPPRGAGLAVQISAKDRVCPMERLGCAERGCPLMRGFRERLAASRLLESLAELGVVDSAELTARALAAELCPFEVSLELSLAATVVVADFNYVFDPNVYLRRFFDADHRQHLLIVDEAHQLPERARECFSAELVPDTLSALADDCDLMSPPAYGEVATLLRDVRDHCEQLARRLSEERGVPAPWVEEPDRRFWEEIGVRVEGALLRYAICRALEPERPAVFAPRRDPGSHLLQDPLLATLYAIADYSRASQHDPESFAALWSEGHAKLLCLDPASLFGARIRGFHAVVCMSATLTPFDFFAGLLGVEGPRALELDIDSPFPPENRLVLTVPEVDTSYRRRSLDAQRIGAIITGCLRARRGNYLAFFGSFAFRDEVLSAMEPGPYRVLLQTPAMSTDGFLEQLRRNRSETLLLCGVLGGVFAEGVDYPGDTAIGVFIVGPGLPAVRAERELIRAYYEQQRGFGFEYAYVYPGLNRVIQAGGRAHRTPTDRAAIVLLGRRFSEPLYRDPLPSWWRQELEPAQDPAARLQEFWKSQDPLIP